MDRQSRYGNDLQNKFGLLIWNSLLISGFFSSPEFEDDPDLYVLKPIKYVGIEVWQVWQTY